MGAEIEDLPAETEEEEAEQIAREHQRLADYVRKHG